MNIWANLRDGIGLAEQADLPGIIARLTALLPPAPPAPATQVANADPMTDGGIEACIALAAGMSEDERKTTIERITAISDDTLTRQMRDLKEGQRKDFTRQMRDLKEGQRKDFWVNKIAVGIYWERYIIWSMILFIDNSCLHMGGLGYGIQQRGLFYLGLAYTFAMVAVYYFIARNMPFRDSIWKLFFFFILCVIACYAFFTAWLWPFMVNFGHYEVA